MKMRSSWMIGSGILALTALTLLSYQNCSVRRLSGATNASSINGSGTGSGAGTSPGSGTGTTTAGAAKCAADNMIQSATMGTFTGTASAGLPAVQTSYAVILGDSDTQLNILLNSNCMSKNTYTNTTGQCYAPVYPSQYIKIDVYCDDNAANATACTNIPQSQLNMDLPLNGNDYGKHVQISSILIGKDYSSHSYLQANPVANRAGTIKFTSLPATLAAGGIVTVELKGAEIIDSADATKKIVIDGTFSGEIMAKKCSSPGI